MPNTATSSTADLGDKDIEEGEFDSRKIFSLSLSQLRKHTDFANCYLKPAPYVSCISLSLSCKNQANFSSYYFQAEPFVSYFFYLLQLFVLMRCDAILTNKGYHSG